MEQIFNTIIRNWRPIAGSVGATCMTVIAMGNGYGMVEKASAGDYRNALSYGILTAASLGLVYLGARSVARRRD